MTLKRKAIPKAIKEQVWLQWCGRSFDSKCKVVWCRNKIDVYNWEAGHNIPHSKGGLTTVDNLRPICSRCNKSMSDTYSIDEWNKLGKPVSNKRWYHTLFCCIKP